MKLFNLLIFSISIFFATITYAQVNQIQDTIVGFQLDFSN